MNKNIPLSPRLIIAGTHSGCGKTTVTTALMAAFSAQGRNVVPFKVGPDFIDPSFHEFVTGHLSYSLDSWLLSEETVQHLFLSHTAQMHAAQSHESQPNTAQSYASYTAQSSTELSRTSQPSALQPRTEQPQESYTAQPHASQPYVSQLHTAQPHAPRTELARTSQPHVSQYTEKKNDEVVEENLPLAIIEGVMGLYDGHSSTNVGSTAHIATILHAPMLLVVDGQGMSLSVAALVSGYAHFHSQNCISGVIFNKLSGEKHYKLLADIVHSETGIPCFGFMPRNQDVALKRRHLGLIPSAEVKDLRTRIQILRDAAKASLDLAGIAALAESMPFSFNQKRSLAESMPFSFEQNTSLPKDVPLAQKDTALLETSTNKEHCKKRKTDLVSCQDLFLEKGLAPRAKSTHAPRIGVLRDSAFSFYYHDNLELLKVLGAELVYTSPMKDTALPADLDGLYLGGGFPEVFAKELSANTQFKASLQRVLTKGLPAYAECGGMMYLMEEIVDLNGQSYPMVGFFEGKALMTKKRGPFGYITVELLQDSVLGKQGISFRAHEFHHSRTVSDFSPAGRMKKDNGESWQGGMVKENTLAWYPHIHFYSLPELAQHFVNFCRQAKPYNSASKN